MSAPKPLSWDDFRMVKAIADARGLTAAAAEMQIDQSTVFRRLGALEASLGTPLFERRRTGYALTATGEDMVQAAERMGEEATTLERRIRSKDVTPRGEIRVATADSLLIHLLTPLFARFQAQCPDIRLDVVIGNSALNLSKRDADIAIRATDAPPENLVGRRIGLISWALYGRAQDFAVTGGIADPQALAERRWVALGEDMASLKVVQAAQRTIEPERLSYRANSVLALAEAIEAGIGIGHLPCFIGDVRPALTRLSAIIPEYGAGLWTLTHEDLRHSPRIRVFMDFIAQELLRLKPLIEGQTMPLNLG